MKLITLNVWGGQIHEPLDRFLKLHVSQGVDIFCFQEVFAGGKEKLSEDLVNFQARRFSLFEEISEILDGYQGYFCPVHENSYGIACFIKKNIKVIEIGSVLLYENKNFPDPAQPDSDHTRKVQWLRIQHAGKDFLVMNLHGYWTGIDKKDVPERIKQSQNIINFVETVDPNIPKILCGDFNLRPDTESIRMLEKHFKNLILEKGITSTRTKLYTRSEERYADYVFVSLNVQVADFKVLPDEVSDHSPLLLEFK